MNNAWTRSTFCNFGDCLEARIADDGMVHVRSSKDPDGPDLVFTEDEWGAFVLGAQAGDFDNLHEEKP